MKHLLLSLLVVVAAAVTARANMTAEKISKGQQLFTTGCLSCHSKQGVTIAPRAYTDANWGRALEKMMRMAKLQGSDKMLLTEYLATVRLGRAELPKPPAAPAKEKN